MFKNQLLNRAKLHSPVQKKKKKSWKFKHQYVNKRQKVHLGLGFQNAYRKQNKTKQNKMLIGFVCVFVKKIKIDDRCV